MVNYLHKPWLVTLLMGINMRYKVWNVYKVPTGRRKGMPCYPGTDEFLAKTSWCEDNAKGAWDSRMGYFEFEKRKDSTLFRATFGESLPDYMEN